MSLRRIALADAEELADFHRRNRDFLAPFDPVRPESYYHVDGLRERIERAHADEGERLIDFAIIRDRDIVGKIALSNVSRGAFQSATVGYSIDEACNGHGYATIAVKLAVDHAFRLLQLHRIEAGTLLDNIASQRVLEKAGFARIGISHQHLRINGSWRDHMLFARVADAT
ncbi:MAG: GNAT family N-acetyltransferase [Thermoleophilia bacterium]|nr:GNAT family N-acetyltransferase [Thermoleophilia bacterium]